MNYVFVTQAQEAAKQWSELSTAFFQQQARLFQGQLAFGTTARDARGLTADFIQTTQQADEFVVKTVRLLDAQCAQFLDAALHDSPARESLAPVVAGYKSASQAVVTAVEQLTQARKALLEKARVS
ncbi:hypothetical protein [Azohydromonas australica]|uniref:hypothetical protein n=1 Tax=Azohydromonas australica TaxID=364039 RepID=UPI00040CDDFF|nr:hypothetical protein [Azohydromonas australica]